jgi:hypothetical protein
MEDEMGIWESEKEHGEKRSVLEEKKREGFLRWLPCTMQPHNTCCCLLALFAKAGILMGLSRLQKVNATYV